MHDEIEHELLEFNNFHSNAGAGLPPMVRIEGRVALGFNHDTRRMSLHVAMEHAPYSAGMVLGRHEHDGTDRMLVGPWCKNFALASGPRFISGNLQDIGDTKPSELPDLPGRQVLIGKSASNEFEIFPARWIGENGNAGCDTATHEVGRLQHTRAARIVGDDD